MDGEERKAAVRAALREAADRGRLGVVAAVANIPERRLRACADGCEDEPLVAGELLFLAAHFEVGS